MARGTSFFRHPFKWVAENLVPSRRERIPPPEPPPVPSRRERIPPPEPLYSPQPVPDSGSDEFRAIWLREVKRQTIRKIRARTGNSERVIYRDHLEVFFSMYMTELDLDEQVEAWEEYIQSFVTNTHTHNYFLRNWDIRVGDFDWQAWRGTMGYRERH